MAQILDLSKRILRNKSSGIAKEIDNPDLMETSQVGCLDSVVTSMANDGDFEPILRRFFSNFPGSQEIIDSLLPFKDSKYVNRVAKAIGWTAYYLRGAKAVRSVAKTLKEYQGLESVNEIARAISFGRWISDKAVRMAAKALRSEEVDILNAYQGSKYFRCVAEAIGRAAYYPNDAEVVRNVCGKYLKAQEFSEDNVIPLRSRIQ